MCPNLDDWILGGWQKHHMGICSKQWRIWSRLNYFHSSYLSAKPNVLPITIWICTTEYFKITAFKIERITWQAIFLPKELNTFFCNYSYLCLLWIFHKLLLLHLVYIPVSALKNSSYSSQLCLTEVIIKARSRYTVSNILAKKLFWNELMQELWKYFPHQENELWVK